MKNRIQELMKVLYTNTIGAILGILLSIILVGGCSYLLFEYQPEVSSLGDELINIEQERNGIVTNCQLCELYKNGWFNKNSNENSIKVNSIYLTVTESLYERNLDSTFTSVSTSWCDTSIIELNSELGQVRGFIVTGEAYKAYLQAMIETYKDQIVVLNDLRDFISFWTSESPQDKLAYMNTINQTNVDMVSNFQTMMTLSSQVISEMGIENDKLNQEYSKITNLYWEIRIKQVLSVLGIILGFYVLIFIFREAKEYYYPPKQHVVKQQRTKSVRKKYE